jgi:predicted secreted protein
MTVVTGSLSYFVIWWLVLFTVLPWGGTKLKAPLPGQALSAPENPRIGYKFVITTLIAGLVWGALFIFLLNFHN